MRSWLIAIALVVAVAAVAAHEKFKIVGTVAALKKDEIAVKSIDGATYEIDFTDGAVVTNKNHKKIDRAKLTVGAKVVVLALGHDMFDLDAYEVQLTEQD
jgi:hypothetical protein